MVPPRLLAHVTSSCKQKKWFQILEVVQTTFSEMKCAHCKGSIKVEKTHLDHSPLRTSSPHHTHTYPRDALQKERVYKLVHTHRRNKAAKGEKDRDRERERGTARKQRDSIEGEGGGEGERQERIHTST